MVKHKGSSNTNSLVRGDGNTEYMLRLNNCVYMQLSKMVTHRNQVSQVCVD